MSHAAFPSESPANHHPQHAPSSGGGGGGGGAGGAGGAGAGLLPFYHVPQQSRREKLRYPTCTGDVVVDPLFMAITPSSSSSTPTAFLLHNSSTATTTTSANHQNPNPHYNQPSTTFHNYVNSSQTQFELAADTPLHGHYGGPLFPPNHQHHHRQPASLSLVPAPQPSVCRGPAEPFTGYAAVLRGSRFLRPAQLLLEEICDAGLSRAAPLLACADSIGDPEGDLGIGGGGDCGERRRTKTRLISMLDEVCRRYKQYCQQIQDVISSFESVAGLSNAAPYTSLALNSMTKHFRSLKGAISDQLRFADTATGLGKEGHSKDEFSRFGLLNSSGICYPGGGGAAAASARTSAGSMLQPPPNVWRPQRGLPERAVAVLKAWLFEHFLHPYPTDADKHMLARQTGLSRNQVSNWFINARVRLWKPLVEEIHALEVRQARKAPDQSDCSNRGTSTGGGGGAGAGAGAQQSSDVASTSTNQQSNDQQPPLREEAIVGLGKNQMNSHPQRIRSDPFVAETANQMEQPPPVRFSFDDFSGRVGGGGGGGSIPSSGGVSLTLGLNQNHVGVCLPEPLPFNVARRFGLEDATTSSPYPPPIGGLHHQMQQEQDRQQQLLGKDIDGQLLREFGG